MGLPVFIINKIEEELIGQDIKHTSYILKGEAT